MATDNIDFGYFLHSNKWECEEAFSIETLYQAFKERMMEELGLKEPRDDEEKARQFSQAWWGK